MTVFNKGVLSHTGLKFHPSDPWHRRTPLCDSKIGPENAVASLNILEVSQDATEPTNDSGETGRSFSRCALRESSRFRALVCGSESKLALHTLPLPGVIDEILARKLAKF